MRVTDDTARDDQAGGPKTIRSISLVSMVVLSMILAGCSGVPFLGDSGPSVDASEEISSKLSVSPVTIYERVEEMTGIDDAEYPDIDVVYRGTGLNRNTNASGLFLRALTGPLPSPQSTMVEPPYMYDSLEEEIVVNISYVNSASDAELQSMIAGEFFRAYMYQQNWTTFNVDTGWIDGPLAETEDEDAFMPNTLIRGSVNYIQQAYAQEYHEGENLDIAPEWSDDASVWEKWHNVERSRPGMQYFQETLDSPAGLVDFFSGDIPVQTTEQILHQNSDEPLELEMNITAGSYWYRVQPQIDGHAASLLPDPRRPRGELGTRFVLEEYLSDDEAAAAADGWGTDQIAVLRSFYQNKSRGVVWAHRWDSPSEADEFMNAMETYAEERNAVDDQFEVSIERISDDVTVILAGNEGFYNLIDVEVTGTTVQVTTAGA